jgi:23S rRNA-/tRNA-specific pseudouridylate synthase
LDDKAKSAETTFTVLRRFNAAVSSISYPVSRRNEKVAPDTRYKIQDTGIGLIQAEPKTGRTHQIRVHLGLEGFPILGDPWYQTKLSKKLADALGVPRLMLHAQKIAFSHPQTEKLITLHTAVPADFQAILDRLSHASS